MWKSHSEEEWNNLVKDAELRWRYPNSFGAAGKRHIGIILEYSG